MPIEIADVYKQMALGVIEELSYIKKLTEKPQNKLTELEITTLNAFKRLTKRENATLTAEEESILEQHEELTQNPIDETKLADFYRDRATEAIARISRHAKDQFESDKDLNVVVDVYDPLDVNDLYKVVKVLQEDGPPVYQLLVKKLGSGANGSVYVGIELDLTQGVIISEPGMKASAIKIADFSELGTLGQIKRLEKKKEVEQERDVLKKVKQSKGFSTGKRHKQVEVKDDFAPTLKMEKEVHEAVIAMPLFPGVDIGPGHHQTKYTYGSMTFTELASKLSRDLQGLHDQNIIHTDLKPANIIWDAREDKVAIVDYGRAKFLQPRATHIEDTGASDAEYMAPESNPSTGPRRFSKASDVFALGKILAEKFNMTGKQGTPITLQDKKYLSYDQLIVKRFINKMLSENPAERPTAADCTQFFSTLNEKMKLDTSLAERTAQKEGKKTPRLKLNQELIQLEAEANKLQTEIDALHIKGSSPEIDKAIADKNLEYAKRLDDIETIVKGLSNEIIPFEAVNFVDSRMEARDEARNKVKEEAALVEKNTSRSRKIMAGLAAVGLAIGAMVGAALVATGIFAPFGAGILGGVALAATIGGGLAFISSAFGFGVAKATQPKGIDGEISEPRIESSHASMLKSGLGPGVDARDEPPQPVGIVYDVTNTDVPGHPDEHLDEHLDGDYTPPSSKW